jgi:two-component system, sensor histidine kinase ChiS
MKRFIISIVVFQTFFLCLHSFAQMQDIRFKRFTTHDGLIQNIVLAATKDHQGFLWFGTPVGLDRYDGYQFRAFTNDPMDSTSISDNWINCICVSKNGDLWIGTQNGGLNKYNHLSGEFHSYKNIPGDSTSLPENEVTSLCEDATGTLWIGTMNGQLCWIEPSGTAIHRFEKKSNTVSDLKGNAINAILEDIHGDLWIGSGKCLFQLPKGDKYFGKYIRHSVHWNYGQYKDSTYGIAKLYQDSHGTLYVGTTGGLYFYDRASDEVRVFTIGKNSKNTIDKYICCFHEDRTGRLWVGTSDDGLYLLDQKRETYRHIISINADVNSLSSNVIFTMCEDGAGAMWVGTYEGVSSYDLRLKPFLNYLYKANNPQGLSNGNVLDIREDSEGGLWLATHGGGLNYLPRGSKSINHYRHIPTDPTSLSTDMLLCMSGNSKDILWIGSHGGGLMMFDRRIKKTKRYFHDPNDPSSLCDNTIFYLYEDRKENLWIGTGFSGVDKFDRATGKFIHYRNKPGDSTSLSGNVIWSILEDSKGFIWIGTQRSGLNRLDPRTGKCTRYINKPDDPKSIRSNSIMALHEYPDGILWIGTRIGLNRFEMNTGEFTAYARKDGLAGDEIASIFHDTKERLWLVATNLIMFDPRTDKIKSFDDGDGILYGAPNQEAACIGRDGKIYIGGSDGFVVFHPDSIYDNSYIPPIVLTDFKIFENRQRFPEDTVQGIVLSHEENYFSFEFAALSFTAPEKSMYRYILEGYDKDWISCGTRRYASYTHVDPGDYVFRVQGSNEDGVWNTSGTSIIVHVVPPFWKTLWFRILVILIVVSIITYIIRRRFESLEQRNRDQQELSKQLLESQENERKRIGIGLHDSLGQNLLVIKNLAVMGLEAGKKKKIADEQLGEISALASQALAEVREISYDLRPHHLDQLGLTGALKSIISRISASSQLNIHDDLDDVNNLFPKQEEINVFRIVQESVNNIIKHSRATSATITVKRNGDQVILTVSDNGIGLNHHKHGFGLTGMAERARILGGTLEVKSLPGNGTTIRVMIPLKEAHAKS